MEFQQRFSRTLRIENFYWKITELPQDFENRKISVEFRAELPQDLENRGDDCEIPAALLHNAKKPTPWSGT